MKMTKAYHAFITKINYFDYDIEFIDLIRRSSISDKIFDEIDPSIHERLSKRDKNSSESKKQIKNHIANTLYSSYIKDVYEEVMLYFTKIIRYVIESNSVKPEMLIPNNEMKMTYREILRKNNFDALIEQITKDTFREIENKRDTTTILEEILKRLRINIPKKTLTDVLPYLEIRHLLVHNDGKIDNRFKSKYPDILKLNPNNKIDINIAFIMELKNKVVNLVKLYDNEIISKGLILKEHLHAQQTNTKPSTPSAASGNGV